MAILEISVVPIGTGTASLSGHLAVLPSLLEGSGLNYRIHPMGTTVEGYIDDLFALAHRLHEAGFGGGCRRVLTHMTLDDRRDLDRPMEEKVSRLLAAARERPR